MLVKMETGASGGGSNRLAPTMLGGAWAFFGASILPNET